MIWPCDSGGCTGGVPVRPGLITRAAAALAADRRVMASVLTVTQRQTGMSAAELAAWLELPVGDLPKLALCARPNPARPTFTREVADLAAYVRCDPVRLWLLLEQDA